MSAKKPFIGFIGLGRMGGSMAKNLMCPEIDLMVYDIVHDRYPEYEGIGASTAKNLVDIAACDMIFLSLPASKEVRETLLGEKGLLPHLREGQIVMDFSSTSLASNQEVAEALAAKGVGFMDAPVSGMPIGALNGTLTIMVGGPEELFKAVYPHLCRMGKTILHMGPVGSGQMTKALNNVLYNVSIAALAEIFPLAVKLGINAERFEQVVSNSTGGSYASRYFVPRVLERNFEGAYPISGAYKDLVNVESITIKECIPVPVLSATTAVYQMAARRNPHLDKSSMFMIYEELLGVTVKK
ncbi:3-hydroxyisobutyrate dehydrogenase [uncultured delta proteobacterium]|uniref:3-hydroxyisobutyrate dehydrogenase n=1 Tax=uncultured delta proteobacterium TaxID=34034 RepID=A0A212IYS3_9DELT|nr:3-hydroxyisobutyrate dehydrogenase [uncultured delta proteobacterium]